jgi:hypothetical protein
MISTNLHILRVWQADKGGLEMAKPRISIIPNLLIPKRQGRHKFKAGWN